MKIEIGENLTLVLVMTGYFIMIGVIALVVFHG